MNKSVVKILTKYTKLKQEEIEKLLESPPKGMGDYAFPCFVLASKFKKNPKDVAKQLSKKLKLPKEIEKVEAKGPYLNFFINKKLFMKSTLNKVDSKFGKGNKKGKALVEHTSINPNASPHVGRARNSIIADPLVRILRYYGYDVETHYYVNDIGKQVAMLVYGVKNKNLKKLKFQDCLKHYIEVNKKLDEHPELEKEIFSLLKKVEQGDKKTVELFKKVVKICIDGQMNIFSKLGIKFDFIDYESSYLKKEELSKILNGLKRRTFKDEDGRIVLNLEEFGLPPFVLTRSDGTSLYQLRDINYTIHKIKRAKDLNIVVLGEDHKLYFQQLSAALKMLGYEPPKVVHYSFILLPTGKMSTRKGNLVLLTDFMKEAIAKAKREIKKRNKGISKKELDDLAKKIGYGAIKYSILKVSPDKNVLFKWEEALNLEGNSAPYLQYATVRAKRIVEKAKSKAKFSGFEKEIEFILVKKIAEFPDIVEKIAKTCKPHLLCNYVFDLAKLFNEFYEKCPVIKSKYASSRLAVVEAVEIVLNRAVNLLGIDIPDRM